MSFRSMKRLMAVKVTKKSKDATSTGNLIYFSYWNEIYVLLYQVQRLIVIIRVFIMIKSYL